MFILGLFHFAFDKVLLKNFTTTTTRLSYRDKNRVAGLFIVPLSPHVFRGNFEEFGEHGAGPLL